MASRARRKGVYAPLSAQYFLDDAILEAGPDAELMWVRILSFLASIPSDGFVTDRQLQIVGFGLRSWRKRVEKLHEVGLLIAEPGGYVARSWLKWNKSVEEYGRDLANDRARHVRDTTSAVGVQERGDRQQKDGTTTEKQRNSSAVDVSSEPRDSGEVASISGRNVDGIPSESRPQNRTEQSSTEQNTEPKGSVVPRKRGTRIPDPFLVNSEMRSWAAEKAPLVNVDRSTEKFVNYWRAKTRDATKLDWLGTWRNWLLSDQERAERQPHTSQSKDERFQTTVALGQELAAAQAAQEQKGIAS